MKTTKRRWRFFHCCQGPNREENAQQILEELKNKGFKAKIHAPLPEHKTSGHIHIVVLSNLRDLLELGGVVQCIYFNVCEKWPHCPADFKHGDRTEDYSCLRQVGQPDSLTRFVKRKKRIYGQNMRDVETVTKALRALEG